MNCDIWSDQWDSDHSKSNLVVTLKLVRHSFGQSVMRAAISANRAQPSAARYKVPSSYLEESTSSSTLHSEVGPEGVAAFVVATLVVLRVIRRTRQRREAINAARGQPDALERPRLWEPVAAGYIQASDAVPHRTSVGSPLVYAAESSGGPSQRELHDSLEREDGSGMSVTVLVAMPAQPERGREKSPAHVAMGVALIDK
ncbi:hypothetical protein C8T65DRAFT_696540 [Cerioporus squamosus]|nr:hypothetical protein C8T65DRAFT_696540 [Cerioporus squamosus]